MEFRRCEHSAFNHVAQISPGVFFERLGKDVVSKSVESNQCDLLEGWAAFKETRNFSNSDARGALDREAIYTRADGWEGNAADAVFFGQRQRISVT